MDAVLTNARIVTPEAVVSGALAIRDGRIEAVDAGAVRLSRTIDCEGDFVMPGLIDIHTDNLERHFFPRPGVHWPSAIAAVLSHDREMLGAGVTTVLDALSFGDRDSAGARSSMLHSAIDALGEAHEAALLGADHFLHFRCELCDSSVFDLFEPYAAHPRLRLVSVTDHTPGQRQWRDLAIYRAFRRKKNGCVWTDSEFDTYVAERRAQQRARVPSFRKRIRAAAAAQSLPVASHDDTTLDDVEEAHGDGIAISEFPTTLEAARHAHRLGMKIVMGSPNVVLGGSHSGNVGARELAAEGLIDVLSSDYVPASMLQAVFVLAAQGLGVPAAVALATANPARLLRLDGCGRIAPGFRADLLRVRLVGGLPVLSGIWRDGREVMTTTVLRSCNSGVNDGARN
jgi:alpha-D-ribose 1-methylphosphonate 5-triphosphate diphosphatase